MKFDITVGSDPELALRRGNQLISAIPVMGENTKHKPRRFPNNYAAFSDNIALEFNIPCARETQEFVHNIGQMFDYGHSLVKPYNAELVIQASHIFPDSQLQDEGANQFGCSPEISTYQDENGEYLSFEANPETVGNLRTFGGHIHTGRSDFRTTNYTGFLMDFESKFAAIKYMDIFVGLPLTFLDKDETNVRRKEIYGAPGSCRPTIFGAEYRTLSNFWIHEKSLVALTFDLTQFAIKYYYDNPDYINTVNTKHIFDAIKTGDKNRCYELFMSSPVCGELKERVNQAMDIPFTGIPQF